MINSFHFIEELNIARELDTRSQEGEVRREEENLYINNHAQCSIEAMKCPVASNMSS